MDRLLAGIREQQKQMEHKREQLKEQAAGSGAPDLLCERYRAQAQREQAPVTETVETVCLEGWTPSDRLDRVKRPLNRLRTSTFSTAGTPLPRGDGSTVLRNNWFVRQFEGITNMFNAPDTAVWTPIR